MGNNDLRLNEIKEYNKQLESYKEKARTLQAEITYRENELNSLCASLTEELGVEVNKDNIQQIYQEQLNQINNTLDVGKAVLAKIQEAESKVGEENGTVGQQAPVQQAPVNNQFNGVNNPNQQMGMNEGYNQQMMNQGVMTQPTAEQPMPAVNGFGGMDFNNNNNMGFTGMNQMQAQPQANPNQQNIFTGFSN